MAAIAPRPQPTKRKPRGPYEEIAAKLRSAIECGELKPGDPLPTVIELANEHGVAVGTAHRALALLKAEGRVDVRRGRRAKPGFCVRPPTRPIQADLTGVAREPGVLASARLAFVDEQKRETPSAVAQPTEFGRGLLEFIGRILDQLSLSAWLPAAMLVSVGALLIQAHRQTKLDIAGALGALAKPSLGTVRDSCVDQRWRDAQSLVGTISRDGCFGHLGAFGVGPLGAPLNRTVVLLDVRYVVSRDGVAHHS